MSFDLFGKTQKRDIRVGYISTDRGYVRGITILEANKYAFKNPGTVFILQTRDNTRYLNINEVNKLTPDDILPSNTSGEGTCDGIVGLDPKKFFTDAPTLGPGKDNGDPRLFLPRGPVPPTIPGGPGDGTPTSPSTGPQPEGSKNPEQQKVSDGSPIVVISGCGGVGAKAIPVIGNDGSVLDIKLIHGGFGYKCPPRVTVIDPNRRGSGVVAASEIGVSTSPTLLTYSDEDDFEEYNFDPANGNPDLAGYGTRVGVDGESLGEWDPTLYATLAKDPIGIEIARYQAFLREIKNPWWSTRKEIPLSVAFGDKKDRVVHEVVHHAWDGDPKLKSGPNTQYQDVEFEVYTQLGGSKKHLESGLAIKFTAEDGSHSFKFTAKNFLADDPTTGKKTKVTKRVKVNTNYIVTSKGEKNGKGVEQGLIGEFGRRPSERNKKQTGQIVFADLVGTANDNDDIQIRVPQGSFTASNKRKTDGEKGRSTFEIKYRFDVKKPKVDKSIKPTFMNNYAISPVPASDVPGSDFAGRWCTFEWEEDFPYTGEYVFRGMADNIGRIYVDNDRIMEVKHFRGDPLPSNIVNKTVEAGVHKIKVELFNVPIKKTVVTNNTKDTKEKVPVEFEVYGQGSRKNTAINMVFTSEDGSHSFTFKPEKDRGKTYEYKRTVRVLPNIQYKVQAVATGNHQTTTTVKPSPEKKSDKLELDLKFDGLNKANNPIEVSGARKSLRLLDGDDIDRNARFHIKSSSPGVDAKFSSDGKKLEVKGKGNVTIRLSWDDNPSLFGVAVKSISVGGKTWKQSGRSGEQEETITVGNSGNNGTVSSTKNITFGFSHDDANDGNRIRISKLDIDSRKPSGSKGPFKPDRVTKEVRSGEVYEVEFITENKAFLRLKDDGKKIECNDNSDNDHKDAIITISDGILFDLVDGGENGQPENIGKAKFRFGIKQEPITKTTTVDLVPEQGTLKENGFKKGIVKGAKESGTRSNVIFADIIGSQNDNDDMQIRCSEGVFVPTNKRKGVQGTSGQGTQKRNTWDLTFRVNAKPALKPGGDSGANVTEIFNTTDYIDKADRKLWRTNLYNTASFLNEYGICPFNTVIKRNEDYDGTHVIRWEHVTFPASGNYQIEVEVDDRVKLFIGNRSGEGAMKIGNGLRNVEGGGDEVIIEKNGFIGDSNRATGKSTYTRFFRKGQYRIRAELYQKPGGDFGFSGKKSYGQSDGSQLTARFERRGNNIFMVMDGDGSATVNLSLKMDDNPRQKGHSAGSVRIGEVELKRSRGDGNRRYKEKELISGKGTFTGGESYRVVISGASAGAGAPRVNRDTIELLDTDGDDANGTITIGKLRNRQGASVRGLNPMALAIRIRADVIETTRISPRTWNQNPMGAAFTIDAPLPPIPVSPKPISEGRCPDNPTWTTRFSGGRERWWPVTHKFSDGSRSWSKFMNRFAISPIPPLATESTDGGGIVYSNSWEINIPHSGFYALKGTVDNGGRILIDGEEKIRGGYFQGAVFAEPADGSVGKLAGFNVVSPPLHKFYLEEGQHTITVEVENQKTTKQKKVERKVFSTKDWRSKNTKEDKVAVDFDVYGQGSLKNTAINFVFTSEDGKDSFVFKPRKDRGRKYSYQRQVKVLPGVNYKVQAIATGIHETKTTVKPSPKKSDKTELNIEYNYANAQSFGLRVNDKRSAIKFDDDIEIEGFDENAELKILSSSPGVDAKFSSDGKKLEVKGKGNVTIRYKWDDKPNQSGSVLKSLTIAGVTWRQKGTKDEQIETITVGNDNVGSVTSKKNITFGFSHDDANDGNRIRISKLGIDSRKPSGSKGPFSPDKVTKEVRSGEVYEVEFITENKAFLRLKDNGRKIECNDNSDNDHKDAIITISDGELFDLIDGGENGQPENIGKAKFRVGTKQKPIIETNRFNLVPEQGTLKRGSFTKGNKGLESSSSSDIIFADIIGSLNDNDDMQIRASVGEFTPSNKRKRVEGTSGQGTQKRNTYDLTFRVEGDRTPQQRSEQGGVTYGGPRLFVIKSGGAVKVWSKFMQRNAVSPFIPPIDEDNPAIVGDRVYVWKNVNFFESGRYKFLFQSDDLATLYINNNKIAESRSNFRGEPTPTYAEISAGKFDVKVVCNNIRLNRNILTQNNPTGFALKIMKDVVISEKSFPWTTNPVGISAMLIPPPCPKVVEGKGVVTDIIVRDPGNGHPPPPGGGVPTIVTLKDVEIDLPGINYDPDDRAIIDGIPTTIEVDNFGRVININTPVPGAPGGGGQLGGGDGDPGDPDPGDPGDPDPGDPTPPIIITTTPVVEIPSLTGVGFRGTPIMETTIVPEEVFDPADIIQVTDLVGLKQTGFVNGKPYYGSVFSKGGQLFAGVYETTGDLIPVYATLQESIDQRVTTRPSAILRQGTDSGSNNSRLNIPGTPENLI